MVAGLVCLIQTTALQADNGQPNRSAPVKALQAGARGPMQDSPAPYLCRWDAHVPLQTHGRDTDGSTKLQLKSAENLKYRVKACSGDRPAHFEHLSRKNDVLSQSKACD